MPAVLGSRAEKASAACAGVRKSRPILKAARRFASLPLRKRRDVLRHLAGALICAVVAMSFAASVAAQDQLPAKTMKDLQQDGEIYQLQVSRATMQKEIQALIRIENQEATEQSHDEGIAMGAFLCLGVLQGVGLLRDLGRVVLRRGEKEEGEEE